MPKKKDYLGKVMKGTMVLEWLAITEASLLKVGRA